MISAGLASFFGGVNSNLRGIRDGEKNEYHPPDRKTKEPVDVAPCVPFRPELKPDSGSPREQLAAWVTDPRNPSFSQATVNRVWALLAGPPARRAGRRPAGRGRAASGARPARRRLCLARLRPAPADPRHRRERSLPARQRDHDATDPETHGSSLGRLSDDAAAARSKSPARFSRPRRSRRWDRSRTGSSGSRLTPAATISSAATATAAKTSSTPAAARFRSGSCS